MAVDNLVGRVLDERYAIEAAIGAGGCGVVYRAQQRPFGRTVAVKVLRPELAEEPNEVARFQREARAIAALSTPHAVKVFDFGVAEHGQLFMVMEYVEGESLRDLMRREVRLSPAKTVMLMMQIAECLAEAHNCGITHRDIKPENIRLTTVDGRADFVKVLDFGIARLADGAGVLTSLTRAGAAIGSPCYMAPEQATATKDLLGPATDVYALGILGYEMVTGRLPFTARDVTSILIAQVHESPAWPTVPGGVVPKPLAKLLLDCLAKKPSARPPSGGALLAALRRLPADSSWELEATGEADDTDPSDSIGDEALIPTLPVRAHRHDEREPSLTHQPTALLDPVRAKRDAAASAAPDRSSRRAPARAAEVAVAPTSSAKRRALLMSSLAFLAAFAITAWLMLL